MPETEQSYSTHRKYFPWHHFGGSNPHRKSGRRDRAILTRSSAYGAWLIAFAFALVVFAFTSRVMSLKAQDRVIRLEERLRLGQLMPSEQDVINSLKARHSGRIALRV